jgi:hypothetical protein
MSLLGLTPPGATAQRGAARVYRIHPAIGIARVGNRQGTTEGDYFLGPEVPGHHVAPAGGYKRCGEITRVDAEILWSATLANRKAYAPLFPLRLNAQGLPNLRNAAIQEETQRRRLLILSASARIASSDPEPRPLDSYFLDPDHCREAHRVHLGDLLTDAEGRLIVLGGYGRAACRERVQQRRLVRRDLRRHDSRPERASGVR